jgi:hypothetical protein
MKFGPSYLTGSGNNPILGVGVNWAILIPVEIFPTSIFQKIESEIRGFTENRFFTKHRKLGRKINFFPIFPATPSTQN